MGTLKIVLLSFYAIIVASTIVVTYFNECANYTVTFFPLYSWCFYILLVLSLMQAFIEFITPSHIDLNSKGRINKYNRVNQYP